MYLLLSVYLDRDTEVSAVTANLTPADGHADMVRIGGKYSTVLLHLSDLNTLRSLRDVLADQVQRRELLTRQQASGG